MNVLVLQLPVTKIFHHPGKEKSKNRPANVRTYLPGVERIKWTSCNRATLIPEVYTSETRNGASDGVARNGRPTRRVNSKGYLAS